MNHYRTYGQLDDVPELVGDAGFERLDMLTDPAMLPEKALCVSENLRFDADGTSVRAGIARQFPPGTSVGTIRHAGIYKPENWDDSFALPTANRLVIFQPADQSFTVYNYPYGETIEPADKVDVVQAGVGVGTLPNLYILRGLEKSVLKFDGAAITQATGFMPGEFALFYGDRIATNGTAQSVGVSDFLDFTHFALLNQFQILKGGDDYLTCFLPFQKDYVLIGARKSWMIAFFDPNIGTGGYSGGLTDTSFLRQLTREAGPVGPRAAIEALGNIWFITDNAIYAFAPQLDNQLTVLGKPLSAAIQPVMDRMSAKYASGACVERWGYRLYFALPISDEPVAISNITVELKTTVGLTLPFTLPTTLSASAVVTYTTKTGHNLAVGDKVHISGLSIRQFNGEFEIFSVTDDNTFSLAMDITEVPAVGTNAVVSKIAERNNTIAVFNLNNQAWESIDTLPPGFYADWLRAADYGTRRRLWVIDAVSGPAIYEEAAADEIGEIIGGLTLQFTLPVQMKASQYATRPIPGRLRTRAMRWGGYPRKIRNCEVRATLNTDEAVTLNLMARTPNNRLWQGSRNFVGSQFETTDAPLRKQCGERALETQVEIQTTSGRPTIRSVMVETVNVGKVPE